MIVPDFSDSKTYKVKTFDLDSNSYLSELLIHSPESVLDSLPFIKGISSSESKFFGGKLVPNLGFNRDALRVKNADGSTKSFNEYAKTDFVDQLGSRDFMGLMLFIGMINETRTYKILSVEGLLEENERIPFFSGFVPKIFGFYSSINTLVKIGAVLPENPEYYKLFNNNVGLLEKTVKLF